MRPLRGNVGRRRLREPSRSRPTMHRRENALRSGGTLFVLEAAGSVGLAAIEIEKVRALAFWSAVVYSQESDQQNR